MHILGSHGYSIIDEPLIEISPRKFTAPNAEWLFFSSANGVKHYFDQEDLNEGQKIAAVGHGTAKAIETAGYTCTFVGEGPTIPQIAADFYSSFKPESVCFPCSSISVRSVQSALENYCQCIDVVVYDTLKKNDFKLKQKPSVALITSPSNAEVAANLALFDIPVVAIGTTTYNALKQLGFRSIMHASQPNEEMLLKAVIELNL